VLFTTHFFGALFDEAVRMLVGAPRAVNESQGARQENEINGAKDHKPEHNNLFAIIWMQLLAKATLGHLRHGSL
jgi:hypothetical protein